MRSLLLWTQWPLVLFLLTYGCYQDKNQTAVPQAQPALVADVRDSTSLIVFEKDIMPILQSKCSPCHFTGGKMYERMPFDKSKTITDHAAGVLKRIKEPDLTKLKAYLDQEAK